MNSIPNKSLKALLVAILGLLLAAMSIWYMLSTNGDIRPPRLDGDEHGSNQVLDSNAPPLLTHLRQRTDELGFDNLLEVSTIEAETFRQTLLANDESLARLIADAAIQFRTHVVEKAAKPGDQETMPDTYDLRRFQLVENEIVDAIAGRREVAEPHFFYGSFAGKWYGIWDGMEVDHHWGEYVKLPNAKLYSSPGQGDVSLIGHQYAWVGDGYGINHVASSADGLETFLLGYVIHIVDQDPDQESFRRPHVGVIDGPDRLIWITKGEVFFEEMIRGIGEQPDRYYITGFRYKLNQPSGQNHATNEIDSTLVASEAFQVVYSRSPVQREPWHGFKIDLKVNHPK